MPYAQVVPVVDPKVRDMCALPYPNHPKGCPNFRKRATCPPTIPMLAEVFDLVYPMIAIWEPFDFGGHVERMRVAHPDWSQRQLECCLYWQGTARAALNITIHEFLYGYARTAKPSAPPLFVTTCPEAMGVNVTETMKSLGVVLEWPPKKFTHHVALAGVRRQ